MKKARQSTRKQTKSAKAATAYANKKDTPSPNTRKAPSLNECKFSSQTPPDSLQGNSSFHERA